MASIKLRGDTSGEIELKAPNEVSGNVEILLPTSGNRLLSDTDAIPASALDGTLPNDVFPSTLPAVNGSALTGLGKILQVQSYTKTNTWTSSGNFKDPGLDVTITPTSTSSKILVNVSLCFSTNATTIGFYLRRNGTSICIADAAGSRSRMTVITECGNNVWQTNANYMYLDSPGTTNAVVYDIMIGSHDGREFRLNRSGSGTDNNQLDNSYSTSTITVMEVGA